MKKFLPWLSFAIPFLQVWEFFRVILYVFSGNLVIGCSFFLFWLSFADSGKI